MPPRDLTGPKPKRRLKRTPVVVRAGDSPATRSADLATAEKFKRTRAYRGAVRTAYKSRPVKERSTYVRQAPATPEKAAIVHTHRAEVQRNRVLREGEARSTGMPERDRRRVARFERTDALSKDNQERAYANALAITRRHRYLPGTNPALNAATAMGMAGAKLVPLERGGLGDDPTRPADTVAKEQAMTKVATDAAKAGASVDDITKALTALDKRHKSPALSILEQFNRPISAVAGGVKGAATGSPSKALTGAVKGAVSNKESFSRILKDAGYSKGVSVGAGLVLDIALDPTTYLTLGASRPALIAAREAAEAAARGAVKQGLEHAAVEAAATRAAERTFAQHGHKGIGVNVGLRGTPVRLASMLHQAAKRGSVREGVAHSTREVTTKGHLTSRLMGTPAAKVAGAAGRKLPGRVREDVDQLAQSLGHSYRPRGFSPVQWDRMRSAAREYRAGTHRAERVGEARMQAYRQMLRAAKVPDKRHAAIIDAVEVRDLSRLPVAERPIAAAMLRDAESMHAAEAKAGVRQPGEAIGHAPGEATGYVARYLRGDLEPNARLRTYRGEPGGQRMASTSLRRRQERMPLADQPEANRSRLIGDVPTIMGERTAEGERLRNLAAFNDKLASHGRRVTDPDEIDLAVDATTKLPDPADMQRFFVVGERGDLTPVWRTVDRADQLEDRIRQLVQSGREVLEVPRTTMEAAWELAKRGRMTGGKGTGGLATHLLWDEPTRRWKWLVTQPNPGYHARNLMGDAWNARLGGATVRDVAAALRTITRHRQHLDGLSKDMLRGIADDVSPEQLRAIGKTERYGSNGNLSDGEVLLLAEQHGAVRAGQIASELRNLRRGTALQQRSAPGRALQTFSESREDLMRFASFRRALKRGDTPQAAAAWANKFHFDYSDLLPLEVNALRRVMPFYLWMARNSPLQLASLLRSPGRFATLEKTRDASAESAGLPEDWALTMPEYVQAGVPFAMPRGLPGSTSQGLPMLASPMLPVTDLQNITPHGLAARLAQSVTPFVKLPAELWAKYDTFYRDKIRKDLVPAPKWVEDPKNQMLLREAIGALPGVGKPTFGTIVDRRTGKRVQGWPWYLDKIARQTPISGLATGLMTEGRERRPGDKLVSLTNWATGVRRQVISPTEARTSQLFEDLQRVEDEINLAKQRRDKQPGEPYGGKLKELSKERSRIQEELNAATSDFAAPYFAEPKRKRKQPKFGAGGGFGTGSFGKPAKRTAAKFGSGSWGG